MKCNEVIIKTNRLSLEPVTFDFVDVCFLNFTEEIALYMGPQPTGKIDDTKKFILNSIKTMEQNTNIQLVIIERRSREFLGMVGLHHVDRTNPELGIWVKKEAHGCAYGLEAVTGVVEWARENLVYDYMKYPVDRNNYASRRIAERNGGVIEKEYIDKNVLGKDLDIVEYWIK